jgi:hypothetical protein
VWDSQTWQSKSSVRFGSRRDQVLVIDQLLPRYHAAHWGDALDLLRQILVQVLSHMILKPTSDRHAAVRELGYQAYDVLKLPEHFNFDSDGSILPNEDYL